MVAAEQAAAMVSTPAPWMRRGAGPPTSLASSSPNQTVQPPSTRKPLIMIHGSRASGAARPLSWTLTAPCPVWRRDAATQAAVNATGPATPDSARTLTPSG